MCTLHFLRDVSGETQPDRKCNPKKISLCALPAQTSSLTSLSVLVPALTSYKFGSHWWGCGKDTSFLKPCKIWPLFLYHPASYLALKGYSRRDAWRISYCMRVVKQQVSPRATPLCSGFCQSKHFSPSPPINTVFLLLCKSPLRAVRPIAKIKEQSEWCVEHGAEERPQPYLRLVSGCRDCGKPIWAWPLPGCVPLGWNGHIGMNSCSLKQ